MFFRIMSAGFLYMEAFGKFKVHIDLHETSANYPDDGSVAAPVELGCGGDLLSA